MLGVAAVGWPLAAWAQRNKRVPRIGVLLPYRESDTEAQAQMAAFRDELQRLGAANVQIDERWAGGDSGKLRAAAIDLIDLRPDVILTRSTAATTVLLYETRTIPVVFLVISDPVGDGFVFSHARPAGNATGFMDVDAPVGEKWLQLLKEIAPQINRVAVLFGSGTAPGAGSYYTRPIEVAASSMNLEVRTIRVNRIREIAQDMEELATKPNGAVIVTPDMTTTLLRSAIIRGAAYYRLPAIYPFRYVVVEGGLLSYGVNIADQYRRAASYVDRILKGEKPADLPVQAPTKYELVINLKTARALGLDVSPTLLARADEVIE